MKPEELSKLTDLCRSLQDADAVKLQEIKSEEREIREQLAALDTVKQETQTLDLQQDMPHRRLGGDVLWQVWVGRRRRDLQMHLARNLSKQGAARQALRKSFGKRSAIEAALQETERKATREKRLFAFDRISELSLLDKGSKNRGS